MHTRTPWPLVGAFLILLLGLYQTPAIAQDQGKVYFSTLEKRLVADGFDPERIKSLYQSDDVAFESRGVSRYFMHNEATLDYKKMTKLSWIREGRVYMQEQNKALQKALNEYGVDPKVITAIILVETKFGRYMGNQSIISILSTMATLGDRGPREYLWRQLPKDRRLERSLFERKADQKADWAYGELKALLTYTNQHQIDVLSLKGSYAGAVGLAQFMPSNILAYGQDGNGDGRIDLFNDADAIISIASYLKHYGWKPGLQREQAYKVVYHYNHSKYYVNTILEIADLLEG
jgi:membrane-bound lytic murein transglycosylase B